MRYFFTFLGSLSHHTQVIYSRLLRYMPPSKPTPNTLPVELLADIFLRWESIDKDGPWTASEVCKHWRHVVLGCPRVWCNVTYELRMISPPKSPWHLRDRKYAGEEVCDNGAEDTSDSGEASGAEDVDADDGQYQDEPALLRRYEEEEEEEYVVYGTEDPEQDEATITKLLCVRRRPFHIWIQRTGGVGFSLDIHIEERYPKLAFQLISDLRALRDHIHCLHKLSISTEETPLTQEILGFFLQMERQQSLPMRLQDFRVVIRGDRIRLDGDAPNFSLNPDALVCFWADFRVSHSLTFDGCAPRFHHQAFRDGAFDPSTLRHLTLRRISLEGGPFSRTLKHFNNLQTLSLRSIDSKEWRVRSTPVPPPPRDVVLFNLTHLTLHYVEPSLCIGLLPTLDAPNLTFFSLRNSSFEDLEHALKDGIAPYAAMTDLGVALARFAESAPNITTFHLAKSPVHDRHFLWRS